MKIVSFNINSIRARPHQLIHLRDTINPDVIGIQETKVNDPEFPIDEIKKIDGYKLYSDNRNFIKEFTVEQKFDAQKVRLAAEKENILFDSIGDKLLKFSFTEKRTVQSKP